MSPVIVLVFSPPLARKPHARLARPSSFPNPRAVAIRCRAQTPRPMPDLVSQPLISTTTATSSPAVSLGCRQTPIPQVFHSLASTRRSPKLPCVPTCWQSALSNEARKSTDPAPWLFPSIVAPSCSAPPAEALVFKVVLDSSSVFVALVCSPPWTRSGHLTPSFGGSPSPTPRNS